MNAREAMHQVKLVEWKERVAACRGSGKPVRRWCQEQGIHAKTYYYWEQRVLAAASEQAGANEAGGRFAELPAPVVGRIADRRTPIAIIRSGEVSIDIYENTAAEVIQALLLALKLC